MNQTNKAYITLHICVFLWGFTAILGKLITVDAIQLVWYRMMFVSILFLAYPSLYKKLRIIQKPLLIQLLIVGFFLTLHWICFYGSIKLANVSVALSMLATTSLMTSILEPLLVKSKFRWLDFLTAGLVFPGIMLIFWDAGGNHFWGIVVGLLSALFAALFTTLNKKNIDNIDPVTATFVEIGFGFLLLTVGLTFYSFSVGMSFMSLNHMDLIYLILLASVFTLLPFILSLKVLKHLSAYTSNLIVSLEPIYGIILAVLIFQENKEMTWTFYLGFAMVVGSVISYPLLKRSKYFDY